jgi:carbamoyl-phosphate synthase small subunit
MKGILVLEDGQAFAGLSVGVAGERMGEVVLNTAVVGYQELMTDPANAGKILVLTYPLIGNYGVAGKFNESRRSWLAALVIKEKTRICSNWQAKDTFDHFLAEQQVTAISEIDTRTLAVKIRDQGEMWGIVATKPSNPAALLKKLKAHKGHADQDWIREISVSRITKIKGPGKGPRLGVLDLGVTHSLVRQLKHLAAEIWLFPFRTRAEKILESGLDGLVISNGPENDASFPEVVPTVKALLGRIPLFGISTGHQIIALALGGRLQRLKVGHHGVNYPVRSPASFKGEITVQNHSWVVDADSIKARNEVAVTLQNVNDATIEEMESEALRFISTQCYPSSPGFDEIHPVWSKFLGMIAPEKRS